MKIKIAGIAKNEANYIPQWIFHHYKMGVRYFEIWVNQTTDDSVYILGLLNLHPEIEIKVVEADGILEMCLEKGEWFQKVAYTQMYAEAFEDGFDYIFFLDLDEYWTPKNGTSLLSDVVSTMPDADSISFQWLLDSPTEDMRINKLSVDYSDLQINFHVKSILKLSERIKEVHIHNSEFDNGCYLLEDGREFVSTDFSPQRFMLSPLTCPQNIPDSYILHTLYRTKKEYLGKLLQGRSHMNDSIKIKSNRHGYILEPSSKFITREIDTEIVRTFHQEFTRFCDDLMITKLLITSTEVENKFSKLLEFIKQNKASLQLYYEQLRGIGFNEQFSEIGPVDSIKFHIDKVVFFETGNFSITGWAYDWFYLNSVVQSEILTEGGDRITDFEFSSYPRPDVKELFCDAIENTGFIINVKTSGSGISLDNLRVQLSNEYNRVVINLKV